MKKFLKIEIEVVVLCVLILAVGGLLYYQYWQKAQEKSKTQKEEPLDYKRMLDQMFPQVSFVETKEKYFESDLKNCSIGAPCTFYVEEITEGYFIEPNKKDLMLVVRRPREELAHAQGFYNAFVAIFDSKTKKILTETKALGADAGDIELYQCIEGTFIFFSGSVTYQGWSTFDVGLYQNKDKIFQKVWPEKSEIDKWENLWVVSKPNKVEVYERIVEKADFNPPPYKMVYSYDLNWDTNTCRFEQVEKEKINNN